SAAPRAPRRRDRWGASVAQFLSRSWSVRASLARVPGEPESADQVRPDGYPRPDDAEARPCTEDEDRHVARDRPDADRQDLEEADHEPRQGLGGAKQDTEGQRRPEQPHERSLEHERPADERVGCADESHDLDLL